MCDPCCQPICEPMMCFPCEPSCPIPCDPCCPPECLPMCPPQCLPICPPRCPPKRCKSRELRSSVLITNCECVKRNGLQLDCPKKECKGRPMCATKPIPICCPSKYMWRYMNVTMGKQSYPMPKKNCKVPNNGDCNPCAFN